jgi:hypothetical protein
MAQLADYGLFLPYREKSSAGLTMLDCSGKPYFSFILPRRTYTDFDAIPPVSPTPCCSSRTANCSTPTIRSATRRWNGTASARRSGKNGHQTISPGRNVPGGSTLATQIEKYRHSPDGLTMTAGDKLRQMASASLRAYLDGSDTRATPPPHRARLPQHGAARRRARLRRGQRHRRWPACLVRHRFRQVNRCSGTPPTPRGRSARYKHVLGLLISQRKPSWYLTVRARTTGCPAADAHLRLLADAGVITPAFRDLAGNSTIDFRDPKKRQEQRPDRATRPANAARTELAALLGVPRLYDLDRIDLTVSPPCTRPAARVAAFLRGLSDPVVVGAGLFGEHLLSPGQRPGPSALQLHPAELTEDGALLRVQADSLDQPFDINQGAKLDMGSSAKLRTLITYLQLVAELHAQYRPSTRRELRKLEGPREGRAEPLGGRPTAPKTEDKAWSRCSWRPWPAYSADPTEAFFTGGGLHTFVNFKKEDDAASWTSGRPPATRSTCPSSA